MKKNRTSYESSKIVFETIKEINSKIKACENKQQINSLIKKTCEKHDIGEDHIRMVGDYGELHEIHWN